LKQRSVKPISKAASSKNKTAVKPSRSKKPQGEAPCPDERWPQVKADDIYGDTKIPERSRKS
jgi:hypothetical protein